MIIAVAVLITSLVVTTRRDVAYGLTVVWALLGIAAKQSTHPNIVTAAQAGAAIIGAIILIATLYTKLKR